MDRKFIVMHVSVSVVLGGLVVIMGSDSYGMWLLGMAVPCASGAIGYWAQRTMHNRLLDQKRTAQEELRRCENHYRQKREMASRIVRKELESSCTVLGTARALADTRFVELGVRFTSMAEKLEGVIGVACEGMSKLQNDSELTSRFEEWKKELQQVIGTLNTVHQQEKALSQQISQLADGTKDLQEMAADVSNIAGQINLLSLNAAIEAARAGERGKGFAVVANEVRDLAYQSGKTGERIQKFVSRVVSVMKGAREEADAVTRRSKDASQRGKETIESVFQRMRNAMITLGDDRNHLQSTGKAVHSDITEVIVGLQFHDSLDKKLAEVQSQLETICNHVLSYSGESSSDKSEGNTTEYPLADCVPEEEDDEDLRRRRGQGDDIILWS